MIKKILSGTLILASIGLLAGYFYFNKSVSGQVPNLTIHSLKGEQIDLAHLKGSPALITFWSTDCSGCIKEIPHLKALHESYRQTGFKIIAIAMHYDRLEHVTSMVKAKQLPYTVSFDASAQAAKAFGNVRLTPTSFLIDSEGYIVMQKIGEFDTALVRKKIEALLEAS